MKNANLVSPTHTPEPFEIDVCYILEIVGMSFWQDGNPIKQRIELPFGAALDIMEGLGIIEECSRCRNEDNEYILIREDGRRQYAVDLLKEKIEIYPVQILQAALANIEYAEYVFDEKE